ncbi:hypothetical protein Patl1_16893 [Pistacia atlantica]|uniref:Uncharacterized protein n=1 Tax=Pistacia atlantica TaxID=434234 RepID=A0ACC1B5U4_9ROSI|nr:hypothetical protein Patl1_16893 [Pistacia atlantica]
MKLTPREVEKLGLHNAGYLAQKRLARGLRLNYTEAVALIATQILEFVRDGNKSVAELMDVGKQLLGRRQVLPAVPHLLDTVQVEGTFPDGTKLITIHDPIASENGNLELALHGSFLPVPALDKFLEIEGGKIPGRVISRDGSITLNHGRKAVILKVVNTGDRPIQGKDLFQKLPAHQLVGSHYHFIEVNPCMVFDRRKAYGMRLNIPAGTATRFEPGESKMVKLVSIGGNQVITGGNGIVDGHVGAKFTEAMEAVSVRGFGNQEEPNARFSISSKQFFAACFAFIQVQLEKVLLSPLLLLREAYANMYGPTTGDKIQLGDTDLYAEIERDFAVYDIGIKDGLIITLGKAGNPDIMNDVHPNMIIGANTEVIAGEGFIVTAGAIDCHVHFICPQLVYEAISSGEKHSVQYLDIVFV